MTIGELITEARLKRRRELEEQLRGMMVGTEHEPRTHDELVAWDARVKELQRELKLLEQSP